MPSYAELAKHLQVSKPRICQLRKMGMPVGSLAAAEQWRRTNTVSRAPTNGQRMLVTAPQRKPRRLRKSANLQSTGDSQLDALNRINSTREAAFELFEDAKNTGNIAAISPLIALHSRIVMTYFRAESAYRAELERRGVLVNVHVITEKVRRCMEAVLKRLKRLPHESGPQCNPQDAMLAFNVLQRAVDDILLTGQQALRDL